MTRWRVGAVAFVVLFVIGGLLLFMVEAWLLPNAADSAEAQQLAGLGASGIFGSGISLGGATLFVLLIVGSVIGSVVVARVLAHPRHSPTSVVQPEPRRWRQWWG
jgi:hypothetical protein